MRLMPTICAGCVVSGFALMIGSSWIGPAAADEKQPRAEVTRPTPQPGLTSKVFRIKPRNLELVEERVRSLLPPVELATVQSLQPVAGQAGGLGGIGGGGGMFGLNGFAGMYGFVNQPGGPGLPAGGAPRSPGFRGFAHGWKCRCRTTDHQMANGQRRGDRFLDLSRIRPGHPDCE